MQLQTCAESFRCVCSQGTTILPGGQCGVDWIYTYGRCSNSSRNVSSRAVKRRGNRRPTARPTCNRVRHVQCVEYERYTLGVKSPGGGIVCPAGRALLDLFEAEGIRGLLPVRTEVAGFCVAVLCMVLVCRWCRWCRWPCLLCGRDTCAHGRARDVHRRRCGDVWRRTSPWRPPIPCATRRAGWRRRCVGGVCAL